jgi:hypothetical protein
MVKLQEVMIGQDLKRKLLLFSDTLQFQSTGSCTGAGTMSKWLKLAVKMVQQSIGSTYNMGLCFAMVFPGEIGRATVGSSRRLKMRWERRSHCDDKQRAGSAEYGELFRLLLYNEGRGTDQEGSTRREKRPGRKSSKAGGGWS